jgi:hypothetical protein
MIMGEKIGNIITSTTIASSDESGEPTLVKEEVDDPTKSDNNQLSFGSGFKICSPEEPKTGTSTKPAFGGATFGGGEATAFGFAATDSFGSATLSTGKPLFLTPSDKSASFRSTSTPFGSTTNATKQSTLFGNSNTTSLSTTSATVPFGSTTPSTSVNTQTANPIHAFFLSFPFLYYSA